MSEGNPPDRKIHAEEDKKYEPLTAIFNNAPDQMRRHQARLFERVQAAKLTTSFFKDEFIATAISVRIELRKFKGIDDQFSVDESTAKTLDFYTERGTPPGAQGEQCFAAVKGTDNAGVLRTVLRVPFGTSEKEKSFQTFVGDLENFANRYKQAVNGQLAWKNV